MLRPWPGGPPPSSARPPLPSHPALINGIAGLVYTIDGQPISVASFTIADGKIAAIDILSDPDRLAHLDLTWLEP